MARQKSKLLKIVVFLIFPLVILEAGLRIAGIGGSIIYVEDPDYGYRPAPSQRFSTMGKPIEILADGFRGPPARTNVLFVGDSVTYGTAYLADGDTFPALLGGANGGVNGWGLRNIAAFLRKTEVTNYSRIVWTIPTCDVLRPQTTLRKGLISTNRKMWFRTEYLFRFLWYGVIRAQPAPVEPAEYDANLEAVRQSLALLKQKGIPATIVFLPYREEALGQEMFDTPYRNKMRDALAADGADILEIRPDPAAASYFRDTAHLSVEGNRWVARQLTEHLNRSEKP